MQRKRVHGETFCYVKYDHHSCRSGCFYLDMVFCGWMTHRKLKTTKQTVSKIQSCTNIWHWCWYRPWLSLGFYCWDKTLIKTNLEQKGLLWLTGHNPLLKSRQELRWEPWGKNWSRSHVGMPLTASMLKVCSVCCFIQLMATCWGMAQLTGGKALPHRSLIKKWKIPPKQNQRPISGRQFHNWQSLFSNEWL